MFSLLFEAPCRANFDFQIKNIDDEGNDAMNWPALMIMGIDQRSGVRMGWMDRSPGGVKH